MTLSSPTRTTYLSTPGWSFRYLSTMDLISLATRFLANGQAGFASACVFIAATPGSAPTLTTPMLEPLTRVAKVLSRCDRVLFWVPLLPATDVGIRPTSVRRRGEGL